ncbi:MAG: aldehyde dehydrogenase family protein, partial [Candidatus Methanomethylophilaceae archaeon]|nr:aldehyde dehydrogenase family protein [Candidatus Methanomethylophilaceae archaeon]
MYEAVSAALKAHGEWIKLSPVERAEFFKMPLETLKARRMYYAALVTVSTGMVREDALREVDTLIDIISRAVSDASGAGKGKTGVWAVISAHNSPLATPVGYAVAAMIAGNAVVMAPSKYCPSPVYAFYSLTEKAGLPGGVLNLIADRKDSSAEELANDSRLTGVVAAGSGERLEDLMFLQVDDELSFINELKGMNPVLVYRPSNIKAAAREIADSAFYYSGQGMFSCSKVIITADEQDQFINALADRMSELSVSDPVNDTSFTGPVISKEAARKYSELASEYSGFVISETRPDCGDLRGPYVPLIAVSGLDEDCDLNYMDSGFPVLNVKVTGGIGDALEELENTECGLSAGIFTKDSKVLERFRETVQVPCVFVNEGSRSLRPGIRARVSEFIL